MGERFWSVCVTPIVYCERCGEQISPEGINVEEAIAHCRSCGVLRSLVNPMLDSMFEVPQADAIPRGCSRVFADNETVLKVRMLSGGSMLALVITACVSGVMVPFIGQAISISFYHATGTVPQWLPAIGNWSQFTNGIPPAWFLVVYWLFLTPFIAAIVYLAVMTVHAFWGRAVVRISGDEVRVFIGALGLGRRLRCRRSSVLRVGIGPMQWFGRNTTAPAIEIEADESLRFGITMPAKRRAWLVATLRDTLLKPRPCGDS